LCLPNCMEPIRRLCGRPLKRWVFWTLAVVVVFGTVAAIARARLADAVGVRAGQGLVLLAAPPGVALGALCLTLAAVAVLLLALRPNRFENPFVVVAGVLTLTGVVAGLERLAPRALRRRRSSSTRSSLDERADRMTWRRTRVGKDRRSPWRDPSQLIGDPLAEREYALSLKGIFPDEAAQAHYIADGWERMQIVLRLLAELRSLGVGRVLELGANPYVLTALMQRRFDFELELANYFGPERQAGDEFTNAAELQGAPSLFRYRHFNVEQDPFPYEARTFDCVLFCEILEHLLLNADRAVAEIARVVRPGGYLIVSTPNATRLMNLYWLALGRNIWDGYSDNGPYGRHNREYTLREVGALLARHGFAVERAEVRNLLSVDSRIALLQRLRPDVWYDHLFVVGRREGEAPEADGVPPSGLRPATEGGSGAPDATVPGGGQR
jgi:SAM-dependent methyltransferase